MEERHKTGRREQRVRVLVTDGGDGQGRSAVAAVRALAQAGYRPTVTVSGRWSLAAASRAVDRRVIAPRAAEPGYRNAIERELAAAPYAGVLAASDAALVALGLPGADLVDKQRLAERALAAGVATPPTRILASGELFAAAGDLDYPVVVKPVTSRFPALRADSPEDLRVLEGREGPLLVQPFLPGPLRAVAGVVHRREFVAVVHQRYLRTWPLECGTASAAETTVPDLELEHRLLVLLGDYEGIFQAQLAGDVLLDLNPRVYGSLPLAVAAGANLPALWCDLLRGERPACARARPGVGYRWPEGELRHLLARVRQRAMTPAAALAALRPVRGGAYSVASWRDPGPMLARLRYALSSRA